MLNQIINVLKTPKKSRTNKQLALLVPLIAEIACFKELREFGMEGNTLLELASCMEFAEVQKDHFTFEYGDVGVHFYVVLSGKVEV